MTAKEFLQRFFILQLEIEVKLDQIARLQSLATRTTTTMQGTPSGSLIAISRIEENIVDIYVDSYQLANKLSRFVEARNEIVESISQVKDISERVLLELRYLCCYPWDKIAKKMNFSMDHIFTIHRRALKNFNLPANLTVNNS